MKTDCIRMRVKVICGDCRKEILSATSLTKVSWGLGIIDRDNNVCKMCLIRKPEKMMLSKHSIDLICISCKETLDHDQNFIFIGLKWKNILKTSNDYCKFEQIKQRLKAFKDECSKFCNRLQIKQVKIDEIKLALKQELELTFHEKKRMLQEYKKSLIKALDIIKTEVKISAINQQYSPYSKLLESHNRQKLFQQEIVTVNIEEDLDSFINSLCSIKFIPIPELIKDQKITIFNKNGRVYLQSIKYSIKNERNLAIDVIKKHASWCEFDNGDILYCGGKGDHIEACSKSYIIESSDNVTELSGFIQKSKHCCCLVNDVVYVFGGADKISEKYLRTINKWKKIQDTPRALGYTCACVTPIGILLSGNTQNRLLLYQIEKDSFSELGNTPFPKLGFKLLMAKGQKIYCLCENGIFESDDYKTWITKSAVKLDMELRNITNPVFIEGIFYFVNKKYEFWKFSTFEHKLEKITEVN